MEKVDELTFPPIVGKYYWVPCVKVTYDLKTILVPIRGELHADPEINPSLEDHWHYDVRFLSKNLIKFIYTYSHQDFSGIEDFYTKVFSPQFESSKYKITNCKRKCLRKDVRYPIYHPPKPNNSFLHSSIRRIEFRDRLYDLYSGQELQCGSCPHKGYSLASVAANSDGVKECPLHGLNFDCKGKVIKHHF
ncbi:MAG: Rieske (2Fe-2S) protein [Xenococcaceae cyanobacterium]